MHPVHPSHAPYTPRQEEQHEQQPETEAWAVKGQRGRGKGQRVKGAPPHVVCDPEGMEPTASGSLLPPSIVAAICSVPGLAGPCCPVAAQWRPSGTAVGRLVARSSRYASAAVAPAVVGLCSSSTLPTQADADADGDADGDPFAEGRGHVAREGGRAGGRVRPGGRRRRALRRGVRDVGRVARRARELPAAGAWRLRATGVVSRRCVHELVAGLLPLYDALPVVEAAREAERGELVGRLLRAHARVAVERDVARGASHDLRRHHVA